MDQKTLGSAGLEVSAEVPIDEAAPQGSAAEDRYANMSPVDL
jgi:hypothetical protein